MKKIITALVLCSTAFAAPAFAADTPFYAGVQVGDGFTILGGYKIDKMFSAELDYTGYGGHATVNNCGLNNCSNYYDYTSFGIFGLASFPMNLKNVPAFSLFGKIGVVRTNTSSRVAGYNYSANDTGLGFGGGAQYDFTKNLSARLGLDLNNHYADNLYIGAIYNF